MHMCLCNARRGGFLTFLNGVYFESTVLPPELTPVDASKLIVQVGGYCYNAVDSVVHCEFFMLGVGMVCSSRRPATTGRSAC